MAKRIVHRHEDGQDETFEEDFGESDIHEEQVEDEDEDEEGQEPEDDDQLGVEVDEARKTAGQERIERLNERKANAAAHAAAAERIRRGILSRNYEPHSKRLLKWAVLPRPAEDVQDAPENERIVTEQGVKNAKQARDKALKNRDDLREELRAREREVYMLQKAPGSLDTMDASRITRRERIKQRQRMAQGLKSAIENHDKRILDLGIHHDNLQRRFREVSGQLGQAGRKAPDPPSSRNQGKSPVYEAAPPKLVAIQRKKDVRRFNQLRKRLLTDPAGPSTGQNSKRGLNKVEYKEYMKLKAKLESYRTVEVPNDDNMSADQATREKLKKQIEKDYDVDPELRPKEDIEGTIAQHGQETVGDPLSRVYRSRFGREYRDPLGWKSTYEFNKEQIKRKFAGLKSGETAIGWGEQGKSGHQIGIGPEKAKATFGPNEEYVIKTSQWEPETSDAESKGQDVFTVKVKRTGKTRDMNDRGEYYEEGQTVGDTVNSLKLGDLKVTATKPGEFRITTHQGEHLNPDQIKALHEGLHTTHGVKSFKSEGTVSYRRLRRTAPIGYSKLPKDIKEDDVVAGTHRRQLYSGAVGAHFGERNPITKELQPGERDSIGVAVGNRALQYHFKEDTDAMGWGTSWRPGNKELAAAALAIPRATQDREKAEAWNASLTHNDAPMKAYLTKYHPDLETDAEVKDRKHQILTEGKALASAGVLASYYGQKRSWPTRAGNAAWAGFQRVPVVGPKAYGFAEKHGLTKERGNLFKDLNWAYRRPIAQKIERAKFRIQHPLVSGTNDPITGKVVPDYTVPGVMSHSKLNIPSWRYRQHIDMPPGRKAGRAFEKKVEALKGKARTRESVGRVLAGKKGTSRLDAWLNLQQGRTMLHDPHRRANETLEQQIRALHTEVTSALETKEPFELRGLKHNTTVKEQPEYKLLLRRSQKELEGLLGKIKKNPKSYSHEELSSLIKSYVAQHPNKIPAAIWKTGKVGGAIGLTAGAGVLAVDRYQSYKQKKGEDVDHPLLDTLTPSRIAIPKVKVQRTMEFTVPHTRLTDALDLQGEKIPIAGRISVVKEEKATLRGQRDISGESYKRNLPLLGGVGVTAPAEVKGSLKDSVLRPNSSSGLGPAKNMYMMGKKVPVDFSVGKKERWDNKQHKLRAKYNRYKLDQEDREHILMLATETPDRSVSPEGERLLAFYHGDEKLEEMVGDKTEIDRVHKKNMYWLEGGKSSTHSGEVGDISSRLGVGKDRSETLEEVQARRRMDATAREEQKRQGKTNVGP